MIPRICNQIRVFHMSIKNSFSRFLQGRYGLDELFRFLNISGLSLILCALICTVIGNLLSSGHETASLVFRILYLLFFLGGVGLYSFALFRFLSRKTQKRSAENTVFLYYKNKAYKSLRRIVDRWKNRKVFHYMKCPKCRQWLRVPKGKGKIRITCPECGEQFIIRS